MKNKRIAVFIIFIIISFLATGCFLLPKEEADLAPPLMETPEISYDTAKVRRGDITNTIMVTGAFVNREKTSLYFAPKGGFIKDIYVGVGSRVKKDQVLAELDTLRLEYNYKIQKLALQKAELKYKKNSGIGMSQVDKELALLELEEQRLKTDRSFQELNSFKIIAPFDGEIVYRDSEFSRGDEIAAYDTLLQVAPPGKLEVMYVGGKSSKFFNGMDVTVTVSNRSYEGEVIQTPRDTPEEEKSNYSAAIFIRLKEQAVNIRRGKECDIEAVIESSNDTLILPKNLVKVNGGVSYVYILEDGLPKERLVETGVSNSTEIEIRSGLQENDEVIKR